MGNKNSCCSFGSPSPPTRKAKAKDPPVFEETRRSDWPDHGVSTNNLQHISEREGDDDNADPSVHPSAGTLFLERSKQSLENGNMTRKKSSHQIAPQAGLKKSSSCSTIYLDDR
jgi:hypothetical protein